MEHYHKVRCEERPSKLPPPVVADAVEVRVASHGKVRQYVKQALATLTGDIADPEAESDAAAASMIEAATCVAFVASGGAVTKAVSCAEIVKRRLSGLHQVNTIFYSNVVDVWEPNEATAGLESIRAVRHVPSIRIILSRDALDPTVPGYQPPLVAAPGSLDTQMADV
eukprot:m.490599 g.490599  ORF g.490599 m.490599 type:complete len:168 (-) comp28378_c0_seq1:73-576(-)